jgi:hypothetical protein
MARVSGASVEVEALGVGALAHALGRADLPRAVVLGDALVAVGVVDRREDEHGAGEQGAVLGGLRRRQDVARQHGQGLLAADLAGVDVAEGEEDHLAGLLGLLGRAHRRVGDDEERDLAVLEGEAHTPPAGESGARERAGALGIREAVEQGDDLRVARRGGVVRPLRDGEQIVGHGLPGARGGAQAENRRDEHADHG